MTDPNHDNLQSQLESYLDGRMDASQAQAFRRRAESDPALAALVRLQTQLDQSLRRGFEPPPSAPAIPASARPSRRKTHPAVLALTAAAVAALVAFAAWAVIDAIWPAAEPYDANYAVTLNGDMPTVYHQLIKQGFKPTWRCKDDHEFAQSFEQRLQQPLLMTAMTDHCLGLSYGNVVSPNTIVMLAVADDRKIVVYIDRADRPPATRPAELAGDLHLFTRQIDQLVLYEVTPLNEPKILPLLYRPSPPH